MKLNKLWVGLLVALFIIPTALAHFPELHVGILEAALNDDTWNSDLKAKILKHPDECLLGLMSIDASVIYYLSDEGRDKYYGGTHSIKWLDECNKLYTTEAQEVYCRCGGLHLVQDISSHGYKETIGYTQLCISKYASTNIFLHSICERSVVNEMLANTELFAYMPVKDQIRMDSCDSYDLLIAGDEDIDTATQPCTNQYADMLSKSAGVNLCQASHLVGANLKYMCVENKEAGSGYTDMYRSKQESPANWKWAITIIEILLLAGIALNWVLGTNKWKWTAIGILSVLLLICSAGIYYAWFNVENFYHDYNFIMLDPLTNFIKVPDWQDRIQKSIDDTKAYLSDPTFDIPKVASGLTHFEDGAEVKGTLDQAELIGRIMWWSLILLLVTVFVVIEIQVFKTAKKPGMPQIKKPNAINQCKAQGGRWENNKCIREK